MREEDFVRVGEPEKTPKLATAAVPVAVPVMAYAQPAGYAAVPYAYAMPNYPVPVHAQTYASAKAATVKVASDRTASVAAPSTRTENEKVLPVVEKTSKIWVGRTKKEVDKDNIKIAMAEGLYKPNEIVPKCAKPDQLFWVVENDGTNTLRTFQSIDGGVVGNGAWKIDPRYGNAYFVVARGKK